MKNNNNNPCIFCHPEGTLLKYVCENELATVFYDGFPVSEYHTLIVPKRHVADYFYLTTEEIAATQELLSQRRDELLKLDPTITGFNIGVNAGESAGQTVFHVHIHLIPRRKGDVENPRGGVRGVIPSKKDY